jgi:hypothetical protein
MEVVLEGVLWINLAQDRGRILGSCENGNELFGSTKGEEFSN